MSKFILGERFVFNYASESVLNGLVGIVNDTKGSFYMVTVISDCVNKGAFGSISPEYMQKMEGVNE